jgi:hypothetical protein
MDATAIAERAHFIRNQLPPNGLFADQHWRITPEPLALGRALAAELEKLGRVLLTFNRAVNLLYRQSAAGKQPAWIARWLDQGKPPSLIGWGRAPALKNDLPRVIRPDLLLTEQGLALTELYAVPGGIGLTAWLNATYTQIGAEVMGGGTGMLEGFASIFGQPRMVHVVVSDEAGSYRPEMEWLCRTLNDAGHCFVLRDQAPFQTADGDAVYRFFELFDLPNVPMGAALVQAAAEDRIRLTPPPKPWFEEKLLLALLWNRTLQDFWHRQLGEAFFVRLQKLVPYTWILDPAELPPHAAIPELNLTDWQQLKTLSQRERELILKISGFSPTAWGARGVFLGSDLSAEEWSAVVERALQDFDRSPYVLQRYQKPQVQNVNWFDFEREQLVAMPGRVRLCPYYFVRGEGDEARASLGGVLATICPADKKIIHGMEEAILAPCTV